MTQKDKIMTLWTQGVFFLLFSRTDSESDILSKIRKGAECSKK